MAISGSFNGYGMANLQSIAQANENALDMEFEDRKANDPEFKNSLPLPDGTRQENEAATRQTQINSDRNSADRL